MMFVRNLANIRFLVSYIFLELGKKYKIPRLSLDSIVASWKTISERRGELFQSPAASWIRELTGDCDDFTTFFLYQAKLNRKKGLKIGFKMKSGEVTGAYHVYPILGDILYDPFRKKGKKIRQLTQKEKERDLIIDVNFCTNKGRLAL